MIATGLEVEVDEYAGRFASELGEDGRAAGGAQRAGA